MDDLEIELYDATSIIYACSTWVFIGFVSYFYWNTGMRVTNGTVFIYLIFILLPFGVGSIVFSYVSVFINW